MLTLKQVLCSSRVAISVHLLLCCSVGVKTEENFDTPEETRPSAEEEEQLQKKTGEV